MLSGDDVDLQLARELVADASDDDLLDSMSKQHNEIALATAALEEFIKRHRHYVATIVRNLIDRYGTASGWTDNEFAEAIFNRVYKSARTYRKAHGLADGAKLLRLKGWLGRIANNLLIDKHRRCRTLLFDDEFLKAVEDAAKPVDFPSNFHRLVYEAMQELADKERLVLVRTLRYLEAGKRSHLPHGVCRALRDELQTTSANIRKIRQRARNHLENYFLKQGEDIQILRKLKH